MVQLTCNMAIELPGGHVGFRDARVTIENSEGNT